MSYYDSSVTTQQAPPPTTPPPVFQINRTWTPQIFIGSQEMTVTAEGLYVEIDTLVWWHATYSDMNTRPDTLPAGPLLFSLPDTANTLMFGGALVASWTDIAFPAGRFTLSGTLVTDQRVQLFIGGRGIVAEDFTNAHVNPGGLPATSELILSGMFSKSSSGP